ncbi:MAG: twin-arginine translocase subunit TatC [Thermoleophilia bacterium]|nr:twin-arginine translocase subunit TatC [Thermoleophilia bacterium]
MSLIEHLDELRRRIIISVVAIAVGTIGCFIFKGPLLRLLIAPLSDMEMRLITLSPTESFMTVFKVAIYGGLIVASPVIIYQIWAFVAPGLKKRERRITLTAASFTTLLFFAGVAFAWFLVLPRGLEFLLNYESGIFDQQVQASRYFSFVAMFLFAFGLVFELPAMIVTLSWVGIVNARTLSTKRKYAILLGAVISASLTPADVFSMVALFMPFLLLYEISLVLVRLIERSRRRKQSEADIDSGQDVGQTAG